MFKRNAKGNTRTKLVTGAVMLVLGLSAAGTAMSTDTFGGGATLPAGGYVGFNFLNPAVKQSANTAFPTSGAAAVSSTRNVFAKKFEQLVRPICIPSCNSLILFSTSPR